MGSAAIAAAGGRSISPPDVFANGRAADIAFAGDAFDPALAGMIRGALGEKAVDFALQPAGPRIKSILIADMDSTIVAGETLDEMAELAGIGDQVKAITVKAMNGELDFEGALKARVALLAGRNADLFERAYAATEISPGAEAMVAGMGRAGARRHLVSGGFKYFVERVAARLGFDGFQSNDIEVLDGLITGAVTPPILDGTAKLETLERLTAEARVDAASVLAVGDGANDAPMLQAAGLGVAWRAKPSVAALARARVDHGDLSTLLLFQRMDPA